MSGQPANGDIRELLVITARLPDEEEELLGVELPAG
jgi:hypothetical protein